MNDEKKFSAKERTSLINRIDELENLMAQKNRE